MGENFAGLPLPFEKGVELANKIKEEVPSNLTMPQLPLRWILDYDVVSVIIPGASSKEQVKILIILN